MVMDGREGMAFPGSAPYYLNRGIDGSELSGPGSNVHGARLHHTSVFKTISNPNIQMQHPNVSVTSGGASGSPFHVENPSPDFSQGGMSMAMVPSGGSSGEMVKKKRGRPRKYGPDGANMSLGLSPMSGSRPPSREITPPGQKARKGRPPGSGWKQRLANVGEWMNSSAGLAFTPHVLHVGIGEDVAAKILAFAQLRARALCILSASGSVSSVTLRQPTTSGGTVTYEGNFEILCLSGSYLLADSGGPSNRTGGISISFCSPDGQILGGAIGGKLIASNPVQVVTCSFVYGSSTKAKSKSESETKDENYLLQQQQQQSAEKTSSTPVTAASGQSLTPPNSGPSVWPSGSDIKNSEINLSH